MFVLELTGASCKGWHLKLRFNSPQQRPYSNCSHVQLGFGARLAHGWSKVEGLVYVGT